MKIPHAIYAGAKRLLKPALLLALAATLISPASGAETHTVALTAISDDKPVFGTVEPPRPIPARVRTGGTVAQLTVKEGDEVDAGRVIATIGDEKLARQMKSLDAQIAGLDAQVAKAQSDLARTEGLVERGTTPKTKLEDARTAVDVASNALRSRIAERSVIEQQLVEGQVLAPAAGRILRVSYTAGAVVLPGEIIATIAEKNFVLRLRVPERHALFLKAGDPIRIDGTEIGRTGAVFGKIKLVYPQIEDGRVVADALVEGLGDYFVSKRIGVWISGGERMALVVPSRFISTRYGIDYATLEIGAQRTIDVPVQRGRDLPRSDMPDALEILSGLKAGDRLVRP